MPSQGQLASPNEPQRTSAGRLRDSRTFFQVGGGGTISFVLFPRASEPSMNFNISKMVYWLSSQYSSPPSLLTTVCFCLLFGQLKHTHGFHCLTFTLINSKYLQWLGQTNFISLHLQIKIKLPYANPSFSNIHQLLLFKMVGKMLTSYSCLTPCLPDPTIAFTLALTAGEGLLLGGGGARYALVGRGRGLVGATFLLSFSFVVESSLFLFLGGGLGLLLVMLSEEISGSSSKNGFVLMVTEFELRELFELLPLSGLSGPKICQKKR